MFGISQSGFAPGETITCSGSLLNNSAFPGTLNVTLMRHRVSVSSCSSSNSVHTHCGDASLPIPVGETGFVQHLPVPMLPPSFHAPGGAVVGMWNNRRGCTFNPITWGYYLKVTITLQGRELIHALSMPIVITALGLAFVPPPPQSFRPEPQPIIDANQTMLTFLPNTTLPPWQEACAPEQLAQLEQQLRPTLGPGTHFHASNDDAGFIGNKEATFRQFQPMYFVSPNPQLSQVLWLRPSLFSISSDPSRECS